MSYLGIASTVGGRGRAFGNGGGMLEGATPKAGSCTTQRINTLHRKVAEKHTPACLTDCDR